MNKLPIVSTVMRIDADKESIDIRQIQNRRFMYDPDTATLILGRQYGKVKGVPSSHAEELADAGVTEGYDKYVRGWVGAGRGYPYGVIHFTPCIDEQSSSARFERAFDTLEMFRENGALADTVVRGFGERWEQPLSDIFTDMRESEQKPSVREQLKKQRWIKDTQPKTNYQQER